MPESDLTSLNEFLEGADLADRCFWGANRSVALKTIVAASIFRGHLADLSGRSVLLRTKDQLAATLALIELDGVARRILLCPPDVKPDHLPTLAANAEIDAVVTDSDFNDAATAGVALHLVCSPIIDRAPSIKREHRTECHHHRCRLFSAHRLSIWAVRRGCAPLRTVGPLAARPSEDESTA